MSRRIQAAELMVPTGGSAGAEDGWRVAFRVDARAELGTGHFMRCLALADEIARRNGRVQFVSRGLPSPMREVLERRGFALANLPDTSSSAPDGDLRHSAWLGTSQAEDARETLQALKGQHWHWLVVDHYAIDARWEVAVRSAAARIIVIDDLADREHHCDVLLDQNVYSDMAVRYHGKVPPACRMLLGPRYALLREEFVRLRAGIPPRSGLVERILIAFGGIDAENLTARAMDAVSRTAPATAVDVVIGVQHPAREAIEETCRLLGYRCHVQTTRIGELMAAADLCIGAGGSALWERCCLGLPTLARRVAENQRRQVEDAAAQGLLYAPREGGDATMDLASHLASLVENPALLRHISSIGMQTVDGRGTARVLRELGASTIVMRRAHAADSFDLHRWRNDPSVRAASRDSAPIERATHEAWLARTLADPQRILLVGEEGGRPVGVVRFDVAEDEAEVSIYLVPGAARVGLGSDLLAAAESWISRQGGQLRLLRAEVLGPNTRSHRLFRAHGYEARSTLYEKALHR